MPPRAIWRGAISFGMVSIPVRIFTATQSKNIHFNQLHASDKVRIKQKKWCPEHDEEQADEIVRGYEFSKGQYVIMEDDDFENLPVASQHSIDLTGFVQASEIDPVFYDKTYYLEPEETGVKPFALLIAALAVKFAIAAFIVPFAFVYSTELLMFGAWYSILFALATATAGVIMIAAAVEGYFRQVLPSYSRLLLGAGGICLIAHGWTATAAGLVLSAAGIGAAHLWPVEKNAP